MPRAAAPMAPVAVPATVAPVTAAMARETAKEAMARAGEGLPARASEPLSLCNLESIECLRNPSDASTRCSHQARHELLPDVSLCILMYYGSRI